MDFDALVDRYEKPIYNLIYRMIGDRDEAADLTQDTFVAAYQSISSFRREASVYTWLYRIAVNRCKNRLKEKERRETHEIGPLEEVEDLGKLPRWTGSTDSVPHAVLEQKELTQRIERAIADLPSDYRIVAVLRDLQGLSYEEIAQAAELSVDVVRTRLARARAILRRKIEPFLEA